MLKHLIQIILLFFVFTLPVLAHDKDNPSTPPPVVTTNTTASASVGSQSNHDSLCEKYHCNALAAIGLIGVGVHYTPKGTNDVSEGRSTGKVNMKFGVNDTLKIVPR
jgi:hypothetical protein